MLLSGYEVIYISMTVIVYGDMTADLLKGLDPFEKKDHHKNGAIHHNTAITPMSPPEPTTTPMSNGSDHLTLSPPAAMQNSQSQSLSSEPQPMKYQNSLPTPNNASKPETLSIQVSAESESHDPDPNRPLSVSTTVPLGTGSVRYHPKGITFETPSQTAVTAPTSPSGMILPLTNDDTDTSNATMVRYPSQGTLDDAQYNAMRQKALQQSGKISVEDQSAILAKLDASSHSELPQSFHLQGISDASVDYYNLAKHQRPTPDGASLRTILDIRNMKTESVKLKGVTGDHSQGNGQIGDIPKMQENQRSKTVPNIQRVTSKQRMLADYPDLFYSHFDEAVHDRKEKDIRYNRKDRDLELELQNTGSPRSVRFKPQESTTSVMSDDSEGAVNRKAAALAEEMLGVEHRSTTESFLEKLSKNEKGQKEKHQHFHTNSKTLRATMKTSKTPRYNAAGKVTSNSVNTRNGVNGDDDLDLRRMSHDEKMEFKAKQIASRHRKHFYDSEHGGRKTDIPKWSKSLKSIKEFKTSTGESLYNPNRRGLLRPLTMESALHIETEYFDRENTPMDEAYYASQSTLDVVEANREPHMLWNDNPRTFFFSLTDSEFKHRLHQELTPSTHRLKTYTVAEDEEHDRDEEDTLVKAMSKMAGVASQSLNDTDIKHDRSVTGIGHDGRIVLSDIGRFKITKSRSEPMQNGDEENESKEESDESDEDVDTPGSLTHHRQHTLHGQLLDALPQADRKNLHVIIHSDFSVQVQERKIRKAHVRAATAKLHFTLKPVHSMKILL